MCLLDPQISINILMTINLKSHLGIKGEMLMWIMREKASKQASKSQPSKCREVEVSYTDGIWYRRWLSSYNFETGKWIVQFYDDNETTEVNFADEVRLLN